MDNSERMQEAPAPEPLTRALLESAVRALTNAIRTDACFVIDNIRAAIRAVDASREDVPTHVEPTDGWRPADQFPQPSLPATVIEWRRMNEVERAWADNATSVHDGANAHAHLKAARVYRQCADALDTLLAAQAQDAGETRGRQFVREVNRRNARLSCGHSFQIGAEMPMPAPGAAAYCPICPEHGPPPTPERPE